MSIANGPSARQEIQPTEVKLAQLPLGSKSDIKLFKENELGVDEPVESFYSLAPAAVDQQDLEALALFRDSTVLEFSPSPASTSKSFQAVHRGEVVLSITPTDPQIPGVQLNLLVYQPQQLAGTPHDLDASFYLLAHRHGVLPQFIKAQVARESGFDPLAWRYEPLNDEVGDLIVSRGQNLRRFETPDKPFGFYRFLTIADLPNHIDTRVDNKDDCQPLPDPDKRIDDPFCKGLPQGAKLIQDDVIPRFRDRPGIPQLIIPVRDPNTGEIQTDPITGEPLTRFIQDGDNFISARDIFRSNDKRPDGSGRWNWSDKVRKADLEGRKAQLTFTAQTALAASYGLLQMTYVEAISKRKWPGTTMGQNPSFLFDTEANIVAGGGSLGLAMSKVRDDFRGGNKKIPDAESNPPSEESLEQRFKNAYRLYNKQPLYATDIVDTRSPNHLPIADRPILPMATGGQ
ncbi:MAG: hypothetical protein ACE5IP_06480 [Terriglobia bacterium]